MRKHNKLTFKLKLKQIFTKHTNDAIQFNLPLTSLDLARKIKKTASNINCEDKNLFSQTQFYVTILGDNYWAITLIVERIWFRTKVFFDFYDAGRDIKIRLNEDFEFISFEYPGEKRNLKKLAKQDRWWEKQIKKKGNAKLKLQELIMMQKAMLIALKQFKFI